MLNTFILLILISFFHIVYSGNKDIIVSYNGYYSTKFRQNLLPKTYISEIQARPLEYSDFDLVKVEIGNLENFTRAILKIKEISKISEDKEHFRNLNGFKKVSVPSKSSSKHYLDIRQIADLIRADRLWMKGFMGEGINIAVFDTGITRRRTFFKNVKNIYDFTNEGNSADLIGHGTFVAGLIASSRRRCSGIAPKSNLHIYKVFTNEQLSTTSWFLDAFNMALQSNIHIINLSIGGPDFMDEPFMSKVLEITANGIILISAIGNDGPIFGTLNNPADQGDVIGVGGINLEEKIAKFSSRGMTTWELPDGYGRVKPDIVTYGSQIFGPALHGGCRSLSGTSVAAPVITGAVALLLSSIPEEQRRNPAMIKQILAEGAKKLDTNASMFEQGAGKLDLPASFYYLQKYSPKITFFPSYIDYLECPYMWPYCSQPIYADGIPTIFNITILNGYGIGGEIIDEPIFEPFEDQNGAFLDVQLEYSRKIWPWSGYLAIFIKIKPEASNFNGIATAQIRLKVKTNNKEIHESIFKFRIKIIPTPSKSKRILWDQYRQMRYPPGYFARDNLEQKNSPLDWNADHPHTNFKDLYEHLRANGYFLEISGSPLTCTTNLSSYSALFIIDPEEEYFPAEILAIQKAVQNDGLNLVIFADWFNSTLIRKIQFLDDNTGKLWFPETGGCNIPALNSLLNIFGFSFGDTILNGNYEFGENIINFLSGSTIIRAPKNAKLGWAKLNDIGSEFIYGSKTIENLPVFGISNYGTGIVSVFGDSNCLEDGTCFNLVDALMDVNKNNGRMPDIFEKDLLQSNIPELSINDEKTLPLRITNSNFAKYSRVISAFTSSFDPIFRTLPLCRIWNSSPPHLIKNASFELDLKQQSTLDIIEIERLLGPRMLSSFDAMLDENAADLPPDDYSLSIDSEIMKSQIRYIFYCLIILFFVGSALVARPRSFAQFLIFRPIRVIISFWYKLSNYF